MNHDLVYPFHLSYTQGCLKIGQTEVVPQFIMKEALLFLEAEIAQTAGTFGQLLCAYQHHATFTGGHQFVGVETERTDICQAAATTSFVFGAMHLGRVFDHQQTVAAGNLQNRVHNQQIMLLRQGQNRVHIRRMTVDMYNQNSLGTRSYLCDNLSGIHLPVAGIGIHQHRYTARPHY